MSTKKKTPRVAVNTIEGSIFLQQLEDEAAEPRTPVGPPPREGVQAVSTQAVYRRPQVSDGTVPFATFSRVAGVQPDQLQGFRAWLAADDQKRTVKAWRDLFAKYLSTPV